MHTKYWESWFKEPADSSEHSTGTGKWCPIDTGSCKYLQDSKGFVSLPQRLEVQEAVNKGQCAGRYSYWKWKRLHIANLTQSGREKKVLIFLSLFYTK